MRHHVISIVAAVFSVFLAACSGPSSLDTGDAGRTVVYEPGVPNFDMEAVVRLEGEQPIVDLYISIPLSSLVFVQAGGRFAAEYEMVVQLADRNSEVVAAEELISERLEVASYDSTVSHRPHVRTVTLTALPGEYVADVMITDQSSESSARRRQAVEVASYGGGEPYLSRPLIEAMRGSSAFEPVVSMHLPSEMDSIRASVYLYNLSETEDVEVTMQLLNFASDTTVASPPYWLIPTRASLQYRGIDYRTADTMQVSRRRLRDVDESAVVVFSLPELAAGMYRMNIGASNGGGDRLAEQERLLSVKNASFPSVASLDELIESLAYIAFEDEIDYIREAGSLAERKRRFDAFWGSLVPNRNLAANLIRLYYGRIEEANLFFTGYKEGWKTDRGMIYTIFGPPIYVDRRVDIEIWHYSYGDRDPANTFVFEKALEQRDDPFETFILQRRPYYQYEWSRAVDRWRDGEVL